MFQEQHITAISNTIFTLVFVLLLSSSSFLCVKNSLLDCMMDGRSILWLCWAAHPTVNLFHGYCPRSFCGFLKAVTNCYHFACFFFSLLPWLNPMDYGYENELLRGDVLRDLCTNG
jgi:hypothetical protein